jgi:hypothetical protein
MKGNRLLGGTMSTFRHRLPMVLVSLLIVLQVTTVPAAAPLKVSDFGDLQTAIAAARDGDTVLVDVDTPGAVVDKRLILRGPPGRGAGGVISGTMLGGVSTGLVLSSGASGSQLSNLKIHADVGIASDLVFHGVIPADDVTVRNCRIEASAFGFYLLNHGNLGRGGWTIEHNIIELRGATPVFGGSFGVALSARWNDTRVAHNKIFGTKPAGDVVAAGGVAVLSGADVEIVQNQISVNQEQTDDGSWADAVYLSGGPLPTSNDPYVPITNVTVSMNDFTGCRTTRGVFGVSYRGSLDGSSDMTGLGVFDHIPASGITTPGTFAIGGNLSSGSPGRGELSESAVPVDRLLLP